MRHAASLLVTLSFSPHNCPAESGFVNTLPSRPVIVQPGAGAQPPAPATSPASGLQLTVDSRWACDYGYRPVRFTFQSPTAAAGDRLITVSYREFAWQRRTYSLSVEEDLTLPAGATSATLTMAVPQFASGNSISWQVWVDGLVDPALSRSLQESLPQITRQTQGLKVLTTNDLGVVRNQTNSLVDFFRGGSRRFGMETDLTKQPLPDRWLHYSGLDVVMMTADEIEAAGKVAPDALDALRRWLTAGGVLWLEGVGSGYRRLPEVSERLGINRGPRFAPSGNSDGPLADSPEWEWTRLRARQQQEEREAMVIIDGKPVVSSDAEGPITSEGLFAQAHFGMGKVMAFEESVLLALNAPQHSWSQRGGFGGFMVQSSWAWRHGLTPDSANADFSSLLPPGAGRAPVTVFRILITLFVLVAGPLNFWVLARRQRMHLMVLTVPLTAALLTLSLLCYAVLAEGFGVQVRVRSLTLLDQPRGEQVVWSRNSYYAGMSPAAGLVFPAEAAVYPIIPGWNDPSIGTSVIRQRTVEWKEGRQHLTRGWLPARESTQLLTVQSQPTEAGIDFRLEGDSLTATTRLDADTALLVVRDEAGEFWLAEGLKEGRPTELKRVVKPEALTALRSRVSAAEPEPPPGLDEGDMGGLLGNEMRRRRRQFRNELGIDYTSVRLTSNLLNSKIEQLVGLEGSSPLSIPPRSYVAITNETGWFTLGLEGANEEESFHVVLGSY